MRLPRGARSAALALIAAAVVLSVFAAFAETPVIRGLETASLDLRFRLRGVRLPGAEATVILVDDRSLAALGRWPLPRGLFAQAVRLMHRAGARVIVFDLLFAEPDEALPADLRAAARRAAGGLGAGEEELRTALERLGNSDRDGDFAAAMREAGNVLLPVGFAFTGAPGEAPSWLSDVAYARFDKSPLEPSFPLRPVSAVPPIEKLAAAAAGLGHTSVAYDLDGEPRYDYAALPFEADFLPSLPVRAAAAWLGVPWPQVALALGEGVRFGDEVVPTDPAMRLLINYRGPRGTFPTYSFADLLDGQVPAAALAGHAVLVGASFLGASDSFAAPFGSTQLPGVERMANIIDTIVGHDFITEIPAEWKLAVAVAILSLAALTGGLTEILPTRLAVLAGAPPLAGWFGAAQWAFVGGLWLPLVGPVSALAAASIGVLLFRYWVVDRDGRLVRSAFRHYLPAQVISLMLASGALPKLGGERREISVVFSDIAGSTALAETIDPADLAPLMNDYFAGVGAAIFAEGGYINEFMGDGVLSFFGAPQDQPDHADRAVAAALRIAAFGDRYSAEQRARGIAFGHTRVGVDCGIAMVGNIGTPSRLKYAALGDVLNTGSRLEGLNKSIGSRICVSAAIVDKCRRGRFRPVGNFIVKGHHEATRVFEPLDPQRYPAERLARYQAAYDALEAARPEASRLFADLQRDAPEDPCVKFHCDRLRAGETGTLIVMTEK